MLKKSLGCVVVAGLMAPALAGAQGLNYNYVQGGFAFYPSATSADQDFIGLDADARLQATENVFVLGGFQYLTDNIDYTTFHVGGGYRLALDPSTDIWGGASIEYQEFSNGASDDDVGLGLRGGLRHRLNPDLELSGSIRVVTGDFDYVGFRATAQYFLRPDLGLVGAFDIFDGDPGLITGARFAF